MLLILRPVRVLIRYWKLAAVAIFSLSVAMAVGIISLSLTNTFFLLPPAAPAADRLVMIHSHLPDEEIAAFSYPDYRYYREKNTVFTDIAAVPTDITVHIGSEGQREVKAVGRSVSDNYFEVLGIRPYLGRFFAPGEDDSKTAIAVMTYACWQRLGADPDIVGKTAGNQTIIGVAPKEFTGSFYGLNGDLLMPLSVAGKGASAFTRRDAREQFLLARLKPGVTKRQAQTEMSLLAGQLASAYPKEDKDVVPVVTRATMLDPSVVQYAEIGSAILLAVVLLVLLIACANVANLLLAVAVGRRQEAAIKLSLGAQRSRIIRDFLKETTVICAASTVFGYLIAAALISRFAEVPIMLPMLGSYSLRMDLRLDATVFAFTAGLMLIAVLATGLAPALYASSPDLAQILSSEIVVGGRRRNRRRNFLVVAQVAVCTLILVGLGLCQRSLYNLRHANPGFASNMVAVRVLPHDDNLAEAGMKQLRAKAREVVRALPGVESVSFSKDLPLGLPYDDGQVQLPETGRKVNIGQTWVDSDYFSTLRMAPVKGRVFDSSDRENEPDVVVINQTLAEKLWPGADPVGRSLMAGDPLQPARVIGVVRDAKDVNLNDVPEPALYFALSQHYVRAVSLIARTSGEPRLWAEPISSALRAAGVLVYFAPLTYSELLDFSLVADRVIAGAVAVLSGLALLLAVLGLLGSISYSVSERRKELGLRVALGARSSELLGMILRQTLKTTGTGVGIGILLGIGATIVLRSQFYGIGFIEWIVLAAVGAGMLIVSVLIASLSAVPWLRVDPLEAVRHV